MNTKKVMFRLDQGTNEQQETQSDKREVFEGYKKKLINDGEEILEEKEIMHKRLGRVMQLILKDE